MRTTSDAELLVTRDGEGQKLADPDSTTPRPRLEYQPALDGLRGIAVAGVIAFHLGYLQGGFLGVDLFFTLSGYLITRLLLLEREGTGRINKWAFWSRRAWRLLPALLMVVGAGAVYAATAARPDELNGIHDAGLTALVYVTNWQFISAGGGYWAIFTSPSPFDHLWSLAIEEQFYVLWPLIVIPILGRRGNTRRLLMVTSLLIAATTIVFIVDDPMRSYLSSISRSSSILIGAALALGIHRGDAWLERATRGRTASVLVTLSIAYLFWSWTSVNGSLDLGFFNGGFFFHAVAVAILIAVITAAPEGRLARFARLSPFRELGAVSYGAYLWHWPIIVVFNAERTGLDGAALLMVRLGLTLAATIASYRLVERPARASWSRRFRPHIVFPAIGVAVAVALIWATAQPKPRIVIGPTPSSTASVSVPDVSTTMPEPEVAEPPGGDVEAAPSLISTSPTELPLLRTPSAGRPLRVLLVGDSYLYDAQPGIVASLEANELFEVAADARLGFALFDQSSFDSLSENVANSDPELVLTMWARFDIAKLEQDSSGASRAEYANLLDSAIQELSVNGALVGVVGLAPSLTPGVDRVPVDLSINQLFRDAVDRSKGGAFYLDPNPIVAPDGTPERWIDTEDGELLVRKADVSHFCSDGSARYGLAIGRLVASLTDTTAVTPDEWWAGQWRDDPRYNDPPGACAP